MTLLHQTHRRATRPERIDLDVWIGFAVALAICVLTVWAPALLWACGVFS